MRLAALTLCVLACSNALAQDAIVFTEYKFEEPTLQTMALDGSGVAPLFDAGQEIPASDWLLVGVGVDPDAGKVYWTHGSTPGLVRRANLDGSARELLVSGLKNPRGLALDPSAGMLYWAASPPTGTAGGMIQRAPAGGGTPETVYLDPDYDPVLSKIGRPTVDVVNGWVYFASNDRILRVNLDGPPFLPRVVVTGVSTARAVALDVAAGHVYWIGADTIEDVVCRAGLDDSDFTVVTDFSPDDGGSNGLGDIALDLAGSTYVVCDDLRDVVMRGALDGSGVSTIYTAPVGFSPSALVLDADVPQPVADCNGNGVRDLDDVESGFSDDCNANGIPDECETDPCTDPDYLLDQSLDVTNPGLQLGGAPENQRWIVFQPFDVPPGGWDVAEVRLDGVTWTYRAEGFTATLLPDDGTSYPDETAPLASGDTFFRFASRWVTIQIEVALPEGRHWVRLTANDDNHYLASVSTVSDGLPSMSRSGLGNDFPGRPPIALRIVSGDGTIGVADTDATDAHAATTRLPTLRALTASPAPGPVEIVYTLGVPGRIELAAFDVRGRRVHTLDRGDRAAGHHRVRWSGTAGPGGAPPPGLYVVRLETPLGRRSIKIVRAP